MRKSIREYFGSIRDYPRSSQVVYLFNYITDVFNPFHLSIEFPKVTCHFNRASHCSPFADCFMCMQWRIPSRTGRVSWTQHLKHMHKDSYICTILHWSLANLTIISIVNFSDIIVSYHIVSLYHHPVSTCFGFVTCKTFSPESLFNSNRELDSRLFPPTFQVLVFTCIQPKLWKVSSCRRRMMVPATRPGSERIAEEISPETSRCDNVTMGVVQSKSSKNIVDSLHNKFWNLHL